VLDEKAERLKRVSHPLLKQSKASPEMWIIVSSRALVKSGHALETANLK
jgi:hypothetical protein